MYIYDKPPAAQRPPPRVVSEICSGRPPTPPQGWPGWPAWLAEAAKRYVYNGLALSRPPNVTYTMVS